MSITESYISFIETIPSYVLLLQGSPQSLEQAQIEVRQPLEELPKKVFQLIYSYIKGFIGFFPMPIKTWQCLITCIRGTWIWASMSWSSPGGSEAPVSLIPSWRVLMDPKLDMFESLEVALIAIPTDIEPIKWIQIIFIKNSLWQASLHEVLRQKRLKWFLLYTFWSRDWGGWNCFNGHTAHLWNSKKRLFGICGFLTLFAGVLRFFAGFLRVKSVVFFKVSPT